MSEGISGAGSGVAAGERVERLAGVALGNDLALELGAMATMASGHGLSSLESPAPVNSNLPNLSTPRGALEQMATICLPE
jgi:hypothetical protein